jgi:hypothetical protein
MQSPKTGTNAGETCEVPGVAFARRTSFETSIGPGMLESVRDEDMASKRVGTVVERAGGRLKKRLKNVIQLTRGACGVPA